MSQYPTPGVAYYAPPENPRPTSVIVVAIIGIVWAVLLLVCNAFAIIMSAIPNFAGPNPAADLIRENKVAHVSSILNPIFSTLLGIVLLAGSIGALKLKSWGRVAMIAFAVIEILISIVQLVISIVVMQPIMEQAFQQMPGGPNGPNMQVARVAGMIGQYVGFVIMVCFPVFVLIFMTRSKVKAAFSSGGMPPLASLAR